MSNRWSRSQSLRLASSVLIGIAVFVTVQLLGSAGVLDSWWLVICLVVVITLIDQRDSPTSLLMFTSLIIGLIPIAGYLHLPPNFSVLALVMGAYSGTRSYFVRRCPRLIGLSGVFVISPALLGGVFTYWWWSELLRGGREEILTRLMPQWDLSAHFMIFSTIFREGVYPSLSSPPLVGGEWAGSGYPAGIHYLWSQFALSLRETSEFDRSVLVPFFAQAFVATGAVAVGILSLAFARLGKTYLTQLLGGVLGTSLGVALFCAGPLGVTFTGGFVNVSAVVIGIVILVSFLLHPHLRTTSQLWILAFSVSILVFNWYPMLSLFVPALVLSTIPVLKRKKLTELVPLTALSLFALQPVIHALAVVSKGVNATLGAAGGGGYFPDTLLIGGSILALGLAILLVGRLRPEILLLLIAPAILLFGLGRYMLSRVGELRYFFDKFGLFAGTYVVILIFGMLMYFTQNWLLSNSLPLTARIRDIAGVVLISVAVVQMFGYWGPTIRGFESDTTGPILRARLMETESKASDFRPLSAVVLREAVINQARDFPDRSCMLLVLPKGIATDAAENEYQLVFGDSDPGNAIWMANVWLHSLSDSATTEFMALLPRTIELGRIADDYPALPESRIDETIADSFTPSEVCILSTEPIISELRKKSAHWRTYSIDS